MSDLALDPLTGDLALVNGRASLVSGADFVAQNWPVRLTLFKGECFRDQSLGIDYQNEVLIKRPSITLVRARFAEATRATPYVKSLSDLQFAFDRAARTLTVTARVRLDNGEDVTLQTSETLGG